MAVNYNATQPKHFYQSTMFFRHERRPFIQKQPNDMLLLPAVTNSFVVAHKRTCDLLHDTVCYPRINVAR